MSEEGLKNITKGDYKTKFKNIQWTYDFNHELPVKVSSNKLGSMFAKELNNAFDVESIDKKKH